MNSSTADRDTASHYDQSYCCKVNIGGFKTVNSSTADRDTAVIRTRVTAAK